ncbi:MAG: gliding motility-associated C-terminal domain-containing protein [Bacteroidetes bacterium]|nr:gliding motility-associated C-terminal domain-containing protein [Bacteroidota bacterium]
MRKLFFCKHIPLFILLYITSLQLVAQRGKHGAKIITSANTIVNEYTYLTADALSGTTTLTVFDGFLNSTSRFSGPLAQGDLILIIQMQGAIINGTASGDGATPSDSTWGEILSYGSCGNYEFAQVKSLVNINTIELDCPISNNYVALGKVQIVRVPRYSTLTIFNSGVITADAWNGQKGGIATIEVRGNITINAGAKIDVSAKGFRGGQVDSSSNFGVNYTAAIKKEFGGEKGEGIAGYQSDYATFGGRYCKGAAANAGGGGTAHNAGGGGGANGGNINLWKGSGNPDISNTNWIAAWNLEYNGFANSTSSGGGKGGYTMSSSNNGALSIGPDNILWGGDLRSKQGGLGGRPLDYSTGKLFLGGGGGAADGNSNTNGYGGVGGGLAYIMCYGFVSGAGQIVANGQNGGDACCTGTFSSTGKDGAGGGGAGGTIVVNVWGNVSGITINANGGKGGDQYISPVVGITDEAQGPGGGGGGGHIAISSGSPTMTATGGANGTTDSDALTEFPANGATKGGNGTTGASAPHYYIKSTGDTICKNTTAIISATLLGTPPSSFTIQWYDSASGGNSIASGPTYTTTPLQSSRLYYVGTCPGTYRDTVLVLVSPTINASNSGNICVGSSTSLNATGGTTYQWFPTVGLSPTTGASVIANPTTTSTYFVEGTDNNGCKDTAAVTVAVFPLPNISSSNDTSICFGGAANLFASGATTYAWSPSAGLSSVSGASVVASASNTTQYVVTGVDLNGCLDTSITNVGVLSTDFADAGIDVSICVGEQISLSASGGISYVWNNGSTTSTIVVSPTTTNSLIITAFDGAKCYSNDTVVVTVNPLPSIDAGPDKSVTLGSSTVINASGGVTYFWIPATFLDCFTCASPTTTPSVTTTYSVLAVDVNGCSNMDEVTITVTEKCDDFFIPSLFSPNGDGMNDVFYVRGGCVVSLTFLVYDRWGTKMFESTSISDGWNGTHKGKKAEEGVYSYYVKVLFENGDEQKFTGPISLIY